MKLKCIDGTCKHNQEGACGHPKAFTIATPLRAKDKEQENRCAIYEDCGVRYCPSCSPIMESTDPRGVVRCLNVCSPMQLKKASGHKYCFNCGRDLRTKEDHYNGSN